MVDAATLSASLKAAFQAAMADTDPASSLDTLCSALATAIIAQFTDAEVTFLTSACTAGGVTPALKGTIS